MPRRIVLPGGQGQVGQLLARHLHQQGDEVTVLSRQPTTAPWQVVSWDGQTVGRWAETLNGADLVVNLCGRSVNCRYTPAHRHEIIQSRVQPTLLLGRAMAAVSRPPRVWMNASTATIYRHALDRPQDEATGQLGGHEPDVPETWHFSIDVATQWEAAFFGCPTPHTRKVALRSAITLSPDRGGIFDVLLGLVRAGLCGTAGPGCQYVSWVHERDFVRAIEFLLHEEMDGPVNIASPEPLPNREFMAHLRQAWGTRIGLLATAGMLEVGAILLRTETELVLKSRRVVPGRLAGAGFSFEYPQWHQAAQELVSRWRHKQRS